VAKADPAGGGFCPPTRRSAPLHQVLLVNPKLMPVDHLFLLCIIFPGLAARHAPELLGPTRRQERGAPCGFPYPWPSLFLLKWSFAPGPHTPRQVRDNLTAGRSAVGRNRFPSNNFKFFELSFQSSLHLSLEVLVLYRSLILI
jgi:hypothetical protein